MYLIIVLEIFISQLLVTLFTKLSIIQINNNDFDHGKGTHYVIKLIITYNVLQIDVQQHNSVVAVLTMVMERLVTIWNRKLEVTESKMGEVGLPRIIKLARKLKLNEKETKVLVYVLCCQVQCYKDGYY